MIKFSLFCVHISNANHPSAKNAYQNVSTPHKIRNPSKNTMIILLRSSFRKTMMSTHGVQKSGVSIFFVIRRIFGILGVLVVKVNFVLIVNLIGMMGLVVRRSENRWMWMDLMISFIHL